MEITGPLCALFNNDIEELTHFLEILEEEYPHEFGIIRSYHHQTENVTRPTSGGMANMAYIKSIMEEVNSHQEDVDASAKALEIEN
mgnify:CR=1 FL=1